MTKQEKFIEIFGIGAWKQIIVYTGIAEEFKEYWTCPYKQTHRMSENDVAEYLKDVWKNEMQVHIEPTDVDNERTTGADRQVPAMYKPEEQRQRQD